MDFFKLLLFFLSIWSFPSGPNDIHVIVTDELVNHIKDESMFSVDILQDINGSDRYRFLLKPIASNTSQVIFSILIPYYQFM